MQNVLSILFCLSLIYMAVTSRVKAYVTILQIQGAILSALLILPLFTHFSVIELILPVTLFVIKVILIPRYIRKIIVNLDIKRVIEPSIQQFTFLLLVIFSMATLFVVTSILSYSIEISIIPFASGFSAIVVGLFIIVFRKKLIVHITGFLVLENGIFVFSTSIDFKLPMLLELGTLLDVFVVVFLMGIVLNRLSSSLTDSDATNLRRLKD